MNIFLIFTMVVVYCKWCYPYLPGLSKGNARVEIPDSLFFFVRSQVAVKSSLRMRSLLIIRSKRIQNVHTSFVLDPH